jgi:programmed cell death 6-interacting protein
MMQKLMKVQVRMQRRCHMAIMAKESPGTLHMREAQLWFQQLCRSVTSAYQPHALLHDVVHLQECVYHKAVMDKKSPGTLARLAKQAGAMYSEVSAIFNQPTVVQHFERSWVAHTKMKVRADACLAAVSSAALCRTMCN